MFVLHNVETARAHFMGLTFQERTNWVAILRVLFRCTTKFTTFFCLLCLTFRRQVERSGSEVLHEAP